MRIADKEKVVFPDLSYKIVGASYHVFNELGWGMQEKYYQRSLAEEFSKTGVAFIKEFQIPLLYEGKSIGKYFADFLIDNKIIVELKVRPRLGYVHARQVLGYLKSTNIKLAILIYFTREGVYSRRVLNSKV